MLKKTIKKIICAYLCAVLLLLTACAPSEDTPGGHTVTDALGREATLNRDSRVVCCYASFAECWLLSGGRLVGVTSDATDEHGLNVGEASLVGSVKNINVELLADLEPDYVILSADLAAHNKLCGELELLGIDYGLFRVDSFEDYKALMADFCAVNERADLYSENVLAVEEKIRKIKEKCPSAEGKRALLVRAYSTGIRAKADDNLAGQILKELGVVNIADENPSLLENMSLEHIVWENPDFILVLTMGNEQSAMSYMQNNVENNKAWGELSAVVSGNYHVLPKDLFHYKPNNRWDKSYEHLAKIFFGEDALR